MFLVLTPSSVGRLGDLCGQLGSTCTVLGPETATGGVFFSRQMKSKQTEMTPLKARITATFTPHVLCPFPQEGLPHHTLRGNHF